MGAACQHRPAPFGVGRGKRHHPVPVHAFNCVKPCLRHQKLDAEVAVCLVLGEFLFREPYGVRERQHIALKPGIPKFQNDRALPPVALPVNLYPFVGITKIGVNHPGTQHWRLFLKRKAPASVPGFKAIHDVYRR